MVRLLLLTLTAFSCTYSQSANYFPTFRQVVLQNATLAYNKNDAPYDVFRNNNTVSIGATFIVLTKVVEVQQLVSYIAHIVYMWEDKRLQFDPAVLGANYTYVPSNSLWIPTVDCFNCNSMGKMDRETESNEAQVRFDGTVSLLQKVRIDAICDNFRHIEAFPFDKQYCGLDFISKNERVILNINSTASPELVLGTPEWKISIDNVSTYPSELNIVSMRFLLERNYNFYIILLILPTMIITSMVIAALTLPLDFTKAGRFGMGLTGLLALTFLLGIMWNQLPRSKSMPVLGRWLLVEEFFVVFAVIVEWPLDLMKWFLFKKKTSGGETEKGNLNEEEEKEAKKKRRRTEIIIGMIRFVIVFGANLLTTILMFTVRPESQRNYQL